MSPAFDTSQLGHARFQNYWLDRAYDEMFEAEGRPRPHYGSLYEQLLELPLAEMRRRNQQ